MRNKILSLIVVSVSCIMLLWIGETLSDNAPTKINAIKINRFRLECYDLLELSVKLSAVYDNPYDPDEIEVLGRFTTPSQGEIVIPGFFYQGYERKFEKGKEILNMQGNPIWKIRFTPTEPGVYRYSIEVREKGKSIISKKKRFKAVPSDNPGFIKVAKDSIYYMSFDSGKPYFAIGESIAWVRRRMQTYGYDYYFSKLSDHGCNYSRIWLVEWNLALEWTDYDKTKGKVHGLGRYSSDNSWRLDYILELAKEKGLYLLLTLDTYGSIMAEKGFWREGRWDVNPYNVKNGGPCEKPEDFWTNEEAKRLYKRRLRYILSRWGCSPNILAFELWNEVNAPKQWVEEMARFIKENDPYQHMVTTSVGYPFNEKHTYDASRLWNLKEIDYTQSHLYGSGGNIRDMANVISNNCIVMVDRYKKPHIVAEFGIDFGADDMRYDRKGKGIQIHNALWASTMSKSFGTPMTHWKEYIDKKNLYHEFTPLFEFVKNIDWLNSRWDITAIENLQSLSAEKAYHDFVVACEGDWGEKGGEDITITRGGEIQGTINQFIHGMSKEGELRITPVFHVNYPNDGKYILDVHSVAQGADISVYLDGKLIWNHVFAAGPGEGEWQSSKLQKEYNVYIAKYNKKYAIDIPKGKHDIRIENTGIDWLRLKTITLTDYRDTSVPFVRVLGLSKNDEALLWVQNKESTWYSAYKNKEIQPIKDISFEITGLSDGHYTIEWWDTRHGTIINTEAALCQKGVLPIYISEIQTDIACKIRKRQ